MSVQTGFEISRPTWDDFFIKMFAFESFLHEPMDIFIGFYM